MNHAPLPDADPADPRPFGAQEPRASGGVLLWGVIYAAWIVFLIVMAAFYSGYGR